MRRRHRPFRVLRKQVNVRVITQALPAVILDRSAFGIVLIPPMKRLRTLLSALRRVRNLVSLVIRLTRAILLFARSLSVRRVAAPITLLIISPMSMIRNNEERTRQKKSLNVLNT